MSRQRTQTLGLALVLAGLGLAALGTLVGLTRVSWGGIMVGTAIATVPFLMVFLALQRHFVAGIAGGAVKD